MMEKVLLQTGYVISFSHSQIDGGRKKLVLSTEPLRASQLAHIADSGLLEQMEWFLPEPLDMAGVTLRLDSMLYIYKENQDVLSFQEIYAIKGNTNLTLNPSSYHTILL